MSLETLDYEVNLPNENDETLTFKASLWGGNKTPRFELEIPAYKEGGKIINPSQRIMLTPEEMGAIIAQVNWYMTTFGGLNHVQS